MLTVFDTRKEAIEPLVKLGAEAARSPADVADRVETVMTSLPSLDIGLKVVSGETASSAATACGAMSTCRPPARAPRSRPPRS